MGSIVPTELTDTHWQALHELTVEAITHTYAPYSRLRISTTALVDDGRLISGCSMENAGYGVILCAECGLVSELTRIGGGRLIAPACVDTRGRALAPCGHCRQFLSERAADGMVLAMLSGMMNIDKVLPGHFCTGDVERVVGPRS